MDYITSIDPAALARDVQESIEDGRLHLRALQAVRDAITEHNGRKKNWVNFSHHFGKWLTDRLAFSLHPHGISLTCGITPSAAKVVSQMPLEIRLNAAAGARRGLPLRLYSSVYANVTYDPGTGQIDTEALDKKIRIEQAALLALEVRQVSVGTLIQQFNDALRELRRVSDLIGGGAGNLSGAMSPLSRHCHWYELQAECWDGRRKEHSPSR